MWFADYIPHTNNKSLLFLSVCIVLIRFCYIYNMATTQLIKQDYDKNIAQTIKVNHKNYK